MKKSTKGITIGPRNVMDVFNSLKAKLAAEKIPRTPSLILLPRIRKTSYKGRGRPKKTDYFSVHEIAEAFGRMKPPRRLSG